MELRDISARFALPSVLVFAFWGTAWIFLLGFGSWYINQSSYHPVGISLWLFETVIPILPGLGFLGAIIGMITGDKLASFLVGLVPNILNFVIYSAMPSFGFVRVYSNTIDASIGFLTLLGAGIGLGVIGLAGSFYGDFRRGEKRARSARLFLLLSILGLFTWLFIIWGWPGYSAAAPGLGFSF